MLLSGLKNWQQRHEGDCLIACCKQVLDYLGISRSEDWLWQQLRSGEVTPFPQIEKLADALGLAINVARWGRLEDLAPYLEAGLPVIVAVDIDDLAYWPHMGNHAVVVVGFNDESVFVNDPSSLDSAQEIDREEFMVAWSYRDFQYAVIRLVEES